jgi:hypothetical protein
MEAKPPTALSLVSQAAAGEALSRRGIDRGLAVGDRPKVCASAAAGRRAKAIPGDTLALEATQRAPRTAERLACLKAGASRARCCSAPRDRFYTLLELASRRDGALLARRPHAASIVIQASLALVSLAASVGTRRRIAGATALDAAQAARTGAFGARRATAIIVATCLARAVGRAARHASRIETYVCGSVWPAGFSLDQPWRSSPSVRSLRKAIAVKIAARGDE